PDRQGNRYVVIQVKQFSEVPVICRVEDPKAGVKGGVMYYRTLHRRPESAPVTNSFDLRTILDLATVKMMQRRRAVGYAAAEDVTEALNDELGGLSSDDPRAPRENQATRLLAHQPPATCEG